MFVAGELTTYHVNQASLARSLLRSRRHQDGRTIHVHLGARVAERSLVYARFVLREPQNPDAHLGAQAFVVFTPGGSENSLLSSFLRRMPVNTFGHIESILV